MCSLDVHYSCSLSGFGQKHHLVELSFVGDPLLFIPGFHLFDKLLLVLDMHESNSVAAHSSTCESSCEAPGRHCCFDAFI